jgi:hypothetical protein
MAREEVRWACCAMRYQAREKFCDSLVYERMLFAARDGGRAQSSPFANNPVPVRVVFGAE